MKFFSECQNRLKIVVISHCFIIISHTNPSKSVTHKHTFVLPQLKFGAPVVDCPIFSHSHYGSIRGRMDPQNWLTMCQWLCAGWQHEGCLLTSDHRLHFFCVLQLHVRAELILHAHKYIFISIAL